MTTSSPLSSHAVRVNVRPSEPAGQPHKDQSADRIRRVATSILLAAAVTAAAFSEGHKATQPHADLLGLGTLTVAAGLVALVAIWSHIGPVAARLPWSAAGLAVVSYLILGFLDGPAGILVVLFTLAALMQHRGARAAALFAVAALPVLSFTMWWNSQTLAGIFYQAGTQAVILGVCWCIALLFKPQAARA